MRHSRCCTLLQRHVDVFQVPMFEAGSTSPCQRPSRTDQLVSYRYESEGTRPLIACMRLGEAKVRGREHMYAICLSSPGAVFINIQRRYRAKSTQPINPINLPGKSTNDASHTSMIGRQNLNGPIRWRWVIRLRDWREFMWFLWFLPGLRSEGGGASSPHSTK